MQYTTAMQHLCLLMQKMYWGVCLRKMYWGPCQRIFHGGKLLNYQNTTDMQHLCLGPNHRELPSSVERGFICSQEVGANTSWQDLNLRIKLTMILIIHSVCLIGEDYLVSGQPNKPLLNVWQVLII